MKTIRVSRQVHAAILKHAVGILNDGQTTYHPDGTVEFPVQDDTYACVVEVDPDPEVALRRVLGVKAN